jgi:hypothetical protein
MRTSILRLCIALPISGLLAACSSTAQTSSPIVQGSSLRASMQPQLVYVTSTDESVAGYDPQSNGYGVPSRSFADSHLPHTTWNPWGVTFDAAGYLYVQSFRSRATTFVYAPGANTPARIFTANGPDTRAVAVDRAGYEYIATGPHAAEIDVVAPKANGRPGNNYHVPPIRAMHTDEAPGHPWPSILATDANDEVIAAIVRPNANALEVFEGGPTGARGPIRVVSGSKTHLGKCGSICDNVTVAFSGHDGQIYVGVTQRATAHISAFAASATGNVAPLRTIQGPHTYLSGQILTGLTVDPRTGEIYIMMKERQTHHGWVQVYAAGANGDAAPLRAFTDVAGFYDAEGIAISP